MKPLRPFKITVVNRAAQEEVGAYYANQVPARGDLVCLLGDEHASTAFERNALWQVDAVLWEVAHRGSFYAGELAAETGSTDRAFCAAVQVHVWPAQGPYWTTTPPWAEALRDDDDDEGEDRS